MGRLLVALLVTVGLGAQAASAHAQVVEETLNVPYASPEGDKQRLDLYMPASADSPPPVLLLVHGGSLLTGDRKEHPWPSACEAFVREGFGCAASSYRLFPDVDWPAPAQDIASAFAWLHENVGSHGGDPEQIVIVGHSSGCMLATIVASDPGLLAVHSLEPSNVFGVVAMGCRLNQTLPDTVGIPPDRVARAFAPGGPYEGFGDLENLLTYYPMVHLGPQLPPFLALIAEEERFKPPILDDAATYVGLARDCQVDAELAIISDRSHNTMIEGLVRGDDPTFRRIADFVHRLSTSGPLRHQSEVENCPVSVGVGPTAG
jgi:acetyl esterase/lipase